MRKLLKVGHITVVVLLIVYCGLEIAALAVKVFFPGNQNLQFWTPGVETALVAVACVALVGILSCSIGIVKNPSWCLLSVLHGAWLTCFTWFGWFRVGGPFTLQELVRVDLSDSEAVNQAETTHLIRALAVYLVIALITSIPLLVRSFGSKGRPGLNPPGESPNPTFQHR